MNESLALIRQIPSWIVLAFKYKYRSRFRSNAKEIFTHKFDVKRACITHKNCQNYKTKT